MNTAIGLLSLIVLAAPLSPAQRTKPVSDFVTGTELRQWFPIYRRYLDSFHDPKRTGLKDLVIPDFQLSYEHTRLKGPKAIAQLSDFGKSVEDADLEITVARMLS